MEGLAGGHVTQLHSTARHRLHPGASYPEVGDPQGRGIQPLPEQSGGAVGVSVSLRFPTGTSLGLWAYVCGSGLQQGQSGHGEEEGPEDPLGGTDPGPRQCPPAGSSGGHCPLPLFLPEASRAAECRAEG